MTEKYTPQEIEAKWQKRWEETGLYHVPDDVPNPYFFLTMFPYPSGDLHIGHWYAMTPADAKARYTRMKGYDVMFPIGFDAFGLPAENAAIKHGIHPYQWTMRNIERMRQQLRSMGAMWDWEREVVTCAPGYYKWNQWFFLQFYKHGLAYRAQAPVDWCPECNTTLAREQVWGEDRHCERCETPVIKKDLEQWFLRITKYAEELLRHEGIDWPERVVTMQRNWIGRSEGADLNFRSEQGDDIAVFTTRPDTVYGATFMVLAPEHPLVEKLTAPEQEAVVREYVAGAQRQTEIERLAAEREKTGVFIGAYAINPANGERIPVWIADYVLMGYGTGAIMAVPAHDERDFAFAIKYGLPIIPVIERPDGLAKSLVFPGSVREGLKEALQAAGVAFEAGPVGNLGEGLFVTLHGGEQIDRYTQLIQTYLLPGNWNEIVGARWRFVFDDGVRELDSVEADREILARCKALYPPVRDNRTMMEMLNHLRFYRDVLFHAEYGTMINSGPFDGTPGDVARQRVTAYLAERGLGRPAVTYRLRDWLISRQRYWGTPIPIVYCEKCGTVPVPEEDLPVLLPDDAQFLPTGESPLRYHEGFRKTSCPQCGGPAERETDTMDTFACSSWYQMRYASPHYEQGPIDPKAAKVWLPVEQYTGGIEHACMHLLYTRFFTKACRDMGLLDHDEPMLNLFNQGTILGEDNEKMSKSRGNVVNPDDYVQALGADAVRAYLMFIGPWELGGSWSSRGIEGVSRFLNRVWGLIPQPRPLSHGAQAHTPGCEDSGVRPGERGGSAAGAAAIAELRRITHKTIRTCTEHMEGFRFNVYLAALMEYTNHLVRLRETPVAQSEAWGEAERTLVLLLAPITPHLAEELWERLGEPYSVHQQRWPEWSEELAADVVITLVVQINGKVRDRLEVPADISAEDAKALALASEGAKRHVDGKKVQDVIYVPGRLVNIVVR